MELCYSCFKKAERTNICPYCGQPYEKKTRDLSMLLPGTVLMDRYIIGHSEGSGGFGIVYRAWDTKLETIVAVKEFFAHRYMSRIPGESQVTINDKFLPEYTYRKERFLEEARTMAQFGNHKSIPNVFELLEANGTVYIVMELLSGKTLNRYLRENQGTVDLDLALMIMQEVGNALRSLHEKKIVHRDVAPDNIFLCTDGALRVKLMDLGAAKLNDEKGDTVKDIVIKSGYSPIEQYVGKKNYGPWTDVYALGATLYMILTGEKPVDAAERKMGATLPAPNELNPEIPTKLNNAILRAMAVDPSLRFQSMDQFLEALRGEEQVLTPEEESSRRKKLRNGITVVAGMVLLAALVFAGIWYFNGSNRLQAEQPQTDVLIADESDTETLDTDELNSKESLESIEDSSSNTDTEKSPAPLSETENNVSTSSQTGEPVIMENVWSAWSETEPEPREGRIIESKPQYQYEVTQTAGVLLGTVYTNDELNTYLGNDQWEMTECQTEDWGEWTSVPQAGWIVISRPNGIPVTEELRRLYRTPLNEEKTAWTEWTVLEEGDQLGKDAEIDYQRRTRYVHVSFSTTYTSAWLDEPMEQYTYSYSEYNYSLVGTREVYRYLDSEQ